MTPRKSSQKPQVHPPLPTSGTSGAIAKPFSQAWMPVWLESATRTGRISEACTLANVTLIDYHEGRLNDPAFDEACRVHDQLVDLRITESLRIGAMEGDIRSQGLYFSRVRDLVFPPASPSDHGDAILSPLVAEAMIRAGVEAATLTATTPKPSRPKRPKITKSEASPHRSETGDLDPLRSPPLPDLSGRFTAPTTDQ